MELTVLTSWSVLAMRISRVLAYLFSALTLNRDRRVLLDFALRLPANCGTRCSHSLWFVRPSWCGCRRGSESIRENRCVRDCLGALPRSPSSLEKYCANICRRHFPLTAQPMSAANCRPPDNSSGNRHLTLPRSAVSPCLCPGNPLSAVRPLFFE